MHKILERQLRRTFNSPDALPPGVSDFVNLVDATYQSYEDERLLSERSMSIASEELVEQNKKLKETNTTLKILSDELREQTIVNETLLRIGKTIASELTLERVVLCVTQELTQALSAEWGMFSFSDADDTELHTHPAVVSGKLPPNCRGTNLPTPAELLIEDPVAGVLRADSFACGECSGVTCTHVRSLMGASIFSRNRKRLGTLLFGHHKANAFATKHESLLAGVTSQAAIAIDNARLFQAAKQASERLAHQAHHDSLTGLPNRVLFRDRLQRCIHRAKRRSDYHFAVLFVDLDRFKMVNDTIGHAAGDQLLIAVADRLRASLRPADTVSQAGLESTVARMGGDEFTILLDELTEPRHANVVAQRIVELLSQPFDIMGNDVDISASVGVCHSHEAARTPDEFLRNADVAMYAAKSNGKSQFSVFSADQHDTSIEKLRIERDLVHALDRGEIAVLYQPILSLEDRNCVGFESLIRWERNGVCIMPSEFVPVAEETGLILPIGLWVLEESIKQLLLWQQRNPASVDLTISVNVSSRQLKDPEFAAKVKAIIERHHVPAKCVKLEITESMMMQDKQRCIEVITELRNFGVGIHLDDFGTGYSSLSYLHTFPLDGLKIDRSFICNIAGRRDCIAVLHAIMSLAHNLDIKVVAEGLEQPEQVALMQSLDCDYGQGFLFARPLIAEDAEAFLRRCVEVNRTA